MILGVTGSRNGGGERLMRKLMIFIAKHKVTELHHGDCIGWDYEAFLVAEALKVKTVAHPCTLIKWRADTDSDVVLPEKPPLDRNRDIVDAVDFLIAAPDGPERQRSGTWSTVRYAKKVGRKGVVWL